MRPTHIRHLIVFVAMLAAVLLYLERVCLSVADVYIREDLRIGKVEMDLAFGAFFIAYALGQVPSGWLSQRYGPRLMLALYMVGWSVFGVFIALAQDVYTLIAARFLLGLSQAGAYPTAALLVKRWVPDRNRGLASSVVAFGGRFGGAGANWLTGLLIVAFVPISTPATVTSNDILKTGPFEAIRALDKEWGNPPSADEYVADADTFRDYVTWRLGRASALGQIDPAWVAAELNLLIREPKLTARFDPTGVALAGDGKTILAKPAGDRSQAEVERVNRLVIEKAFPGAIKQLHVGGWRPTLLLYGVAGIAVGALFWVLVRNWPREHPWANRSEVDLIETGQSRVGEEANPTAIPWGLLVRSRNQWLFSATNFFSNVGWVFLISLMPRFLDERFAVPVDQRGLMTTIPLFVASLGLIAGGWFTDRLAQKYGRRWGRAIPMGLFKLPCVVALVAVPFLPTAEAVVVALTAVSVFQDFGIPSVWAFAQDTGGKQAATVIGWGNMWGNFGAGVAIYTTGRLAEALGWDAAMYALAGAFALCGVAGMLCNASEPLFKAEEPS